MRASLDGARDIAGDVVGTWWRLRLGLVLSGSGGLRLRGLIWQVDLDDCCVGGTVAGKVALSCRRIFWGPDGNPLGSGVEVRPSSTRTGPSPFLRLTPATALGFLVLPPAPAMSVTPFRLVMAPAMLPVTSMSLAPRGSFRPLYFRRPRPVFLCPRYRPSPRHLFSLCRPF